MQNRLDELNYFNDPRTQGEREAPTVFVDDEEIVLPSKFDVCPVCEGNGTTVNPAIDAGGLSGDCLDDSDFMEDYRDGTYDVTCTTCDGRRVIPVVDEARCTPEQIEAYKDQLQGEAEYRAERAAEIRAGC